MAVVYTNQVISDPGGAAMFVADPKKPVGGHVLAHASTVRVSLRKGKAEQRVAKVVVSPSMRKYSRPARRLLPAGADACCAGCHADSQ